MKTVNIVKLHIPKYNYHELSFMCPECLEKNDLSADKRYSKLTCYSCLEVFKVGEIFER